MRAISTIFLGLILLSSSCSEKSKTVPLESCQGQCGCDSINSIMCTEELRSLILQARNLNGMPLVLDKIISTRSNGQQFEFKREAFVGMDTAAGYAFWSDVKFDNTRKAGEAILVKGIKNNQELFSRSFKIAHDCCHVVLVEGNTSVTVPTL